MRLILIMSLMLILSSCRYGVTFSNFKVIGEHKQNLELVYDQELTTENQKILKEYFKGIKDFLYEFKTNVNYQNYTHRKFFRYFNDSYCEDIVISKQMYETIMNKCNVRGFYICAEEVRYYTEMLKEAKKLLTELEITKINDNNNCQRKLRALGI